MQPNYPPQYAPPMPQYPQQPAAYPQQPYAQPAPPAAYPQQPTYPQQPAAYPQGYAQGYAQPQYAPPPPPAAPLPTGTLDGFYSQPSSGGGPSFKFRDANANPQIGKSYAGIVARPITDADIRAQTDNNGRVQTFKDGRTKFVLIVPMQVQPSTEFPDGQAGWWVKGQARDELARAMAEAGAPAGAPEAGAGIRVTLVSVRPVPNMSPAYQYRVEYMRPAGAAPVPAGAVPILHPQGSVHGPDDRNYAGYAPAPQPQYAPVQQPQQVPPPPAYAPAAVQAVHQPMPQPVQAAAPAATPQGFNDEQAALFAKLTGGQAAA
jgi:hypothetical protein